MTHMRFGWLLLVLALVTTACGGDDPVVPLPNKFASIHAGLIHTCGILEDGAAFCWGGNDLGQLGDGSRSARTSPRLVLGDLRFADLGAGGGHTCGVTSAGAVYCWGMNINGQLGDGTTTDRATPGQTTGDVTFASLSGAGSYNCGLDDTGGSHCWGWNQLGQLGDGSTIDRFAPVPTAGGLTFTSVTTHAFHTCGLTGAGEAYCWGDNSDGQLGTGDTQSSTTPVKVATGVLFTSLDVGYYHTCGVGTDVKVYCWGSNGFGQVGLGPDASGGTQATPTEVVGGHLFSAVTAGAAFTCAIEQGTGSAYCWGFNGSGQLGGESPDGCSDEGFEFPCALSPQAVGGSLSFASISANTQHVCGLSTDGVAYCWGLGTQGQLGNGEQGDGVFSLEPVRVLGQP